MADNKRLVIENENQASDFLKRALGGEFENKNVDFEFSNWPVISLRARGEGYDSTITPDMAEALVQLQTSMNRAYARFVNDRPNARALTAEQRQDIQFKAKVKSGSSLIEINLGEFAEKLSTALAGKMSSTELVVTILGLAFVAGSYLVIKSFLKDRAEEKVADVDFKKSVALSQQETRRLGIVTAALAGRPKLQTTFEDFEESRIEMLRSVGDAESIAVNGMELTNAEARSMSTARRERAKPLQLNGNYKILKLDWQDAENVRIWLTGDGRPGEFVASLSTETITEEHKELLKDAEWGRKSLYMQINATELRGEVNSARIVSVSWPRRRKILPEDGKV